MTPFHNATEKVRYEVVKYLMQVASLVLLASATVPSFAHVSSLAPAALSLFRILSNSHLHYMTVLISLQT